MSPMLKKINQRQWEAEWDWLRPRLGLLGLVAMLAALTLTWWPL